MISLIVFVFWALVICFGIYFGGLLILALFGAIAEPFLPEPDWDKLAREQEERDRITDDWDSYSR